jgi:hypothetical protein
MGADAIGDVLDRKNIAALVRFERVAVEDPRGVSLNGAVPMKDVEYAFITPPYSSGNSEFVKDPKKWLAECHLKARNGGPADQRIAEHYQQQYDAWKQGMEIPEDGTPIRGWPMLTPAQQENCIRVKIPTVEYLAEATADGLKALGMGSLDLKRKAIAWLAQAKDKGPLTLEIAAVRKENDALKVSLDTLQRQVKTLLEERDTSKRSHKRKESDEAA